jgi:hypothetical protein
MSAQKAMPGGTANNGAPTQAAKKAAARRKLAAFEYSNEAIERISVAPPAPAVLANTSIESIISSMKFSTVIFHTIYSIDILQPSYLCRGRGKKG